MSDLPYARSSITQAFDKAAALKGDEARQEIIEIFKRVAARCDDWLAGNDEILTDDAAPDMRGVQYANYYRNVNMATNSPAHFPKLERLTEVYTAENNLLDNTQRALMEHHLRFDNDPDDPGYFSVTEQAKAMQAMAEKVQGETDDVTRKTYTVYDSGEFDTHRVMPTHDDEDLLQDWAKKYGSPNEAEMHMLSEYTDVHVYDIFDWFKDRNLQSNAITLVMGEAFSHGRALREIGLLRYRAACVQTRWLQKLARLREAHEVFEQDDDGEEHDQESSGTPPGGAGGRKGKKARLQITLEEVREDMKPYICIEMD